MVQINFIRFPKVKVAVEPLEIANNIEKYKGLFDIMRVGVLMDKTIIVFAEESISDVVPLVLAEASELPTWLNKLLDPNTKKEDFNLVETHKAIVENGRIVNIENWDWKIGGIIPEKWWDADFVADLQSRLNMLKQWIKKT